MTINVERAIRRAERAESLASAEANGAWVIRKHKTLRIPNKSECEAKHVSGSQTCFHDLPYTLACRKCRRSELDANANLLRIKALLSIT